MITPDCKHAVYVLIQHSYNLFINIELHCKKQKMPKITTQ